MQGTTFKDNVAGEGPAVKSDGDMIHMDNVLFEGNSLYCSEGDYGYDEKIDATDVSEALSLLVISPSSCTSFLPGIDRRTPKMFMAWL